MDEIEYIDYDPIPGFGVFDNRIYDQPNMGANNQSRNRMMPTQPVNIESIQTLRTRAVQRPTPSMLKRLDLER
jgi:hypothetical protein